MTPQEVIDILKMFTTDKFQRCTSSEFDDAIYVAIEALEKQIPKKPKETDAYPHRLYCPTCHWTFCFNKENADGYRMMHMFTYCPECGQAIDWSDNNG